MVSVIMGMCYVRSDLNMLERAIRSVLQQTYPNFEFLICEYGSTPEAKACLHRFEASDSRVVLLMGASPGTLAQNLNRCLAEAKGRYIVRMDDDDFSHPDRLTKQMAFMKEHLEIAFVGSNVNLCRDGRVVGVRMLPMLPTVKDFYMTQPYIHPSLLFRRVALEAVGGYSEDKHCVLCEDYDLLLRLYAKGFRGANLQETLLDYTVPATTKGNRTMSHRWNETVTRWRRFLELGMLPGALPFVVKPLAVGLLPERVLGELKRKRDMERYR